MFPPMEAPSKIMRLGDYAQVLAILGSAAQAFRSADLPDLVTKVSTEATEILSLMAQVRQEPEVTPQEEEN